MSVEGVSPLPKFFTLKSQEITEKFIEGTTLTVTLTNEIGHEIFTKSFPQKEEFQNFINEYIISFPGYSTGLAMFIPPRTESWEGLVKDVLFPTLVNHALKQQGTAGKVGGSVAGLALDILTLIPRVIATPFRLFYNNSIQRLDHPLDELLKDNLEAMSSLKNGYLIAHMDMQEVKIDEEECNEENWKLFAAIVKTVKVSQPIIANYNMPCPIQEEVEVQVSATSYEGGVRKLDRDAVIYRYSSRSNSKKSTRFHFFRGLEKIEPLTNSMFSNDLTS